ncbi:unnamed protein product [Phyllotreta striolata]|uniref:Uncharacterized protein n=1 Tax=Phyllotreta striolata TaxID=444603 RepID=A0A9N9TR81_PHYSR|nr:unnamed protein product [Phyllotreta striolata]
MEVKEERSSSTSTSTSTSTLASATTSSTAIASLGSKTGKSPRRITDDDSLKGRFGWAQIMTHDLPYLFRSDSKYVCYKMLEIRICAKLFAGYYKQLVSCANVKYAQVTQAEAGLLNDINSNHCNFQFGKEKYSTEDILLKLNDAGQLCAFLHACYLRIENIKEYDISNRCGFIRINKESVVPYVVLGGQKCVPLFYFEGEISYLKKFTLRAEGWDFAYLKFCCKIQGIRNDLILGSYCPVVSITHLTNHFPPDTVFEEYWPGRSAGDKFKQKSDAPVSLNSLYNMAVNAITVPEANVHHYKSPPRKRLAVLPKFIKVAKEPIAAGNPPSSSSTLVAVSHEYSSSSYSVYKMQYVMVHDKIVICINMKPNDINDRWVPVVDLSTDFFFGIPVSVCEQVIDVLGIDIYKANTAQMRILKTTGRYSTNEVLSMVKIDKIMQFLPQLTYMIKNIIYKSQSIKSKQ